MEPNPDEMTDWTTSATISDTLWSFFRSNPKDPIYNFRTFAFPALIRVMWVLTSWIWVFCCIGVAVYVVVTAVQQGGVEYLQQRAKVDAAKKEFCSEIRRKSAELQTRLNSTAFLNGAVLDE